MEDKINVSNERINSELTIFLFKEDDNFIAYSPALDLSGYGKTEDDARASFDIVLKEYFDYTIHEGTLYQDLKSHGKLYDELGKKGYVERVPLNNDMSAPLWRLVNSNDRTERICQSLREIRMIKDSGQKPKTADELFDEL